MEEETALAGIDQVCNVVRNSAGKIRRSISEVIERKSGEPEVRFNYEIGEKILQDASEVCKELLSIGGKFRQGLNGLKDAKGARRQARQDYDKAVDFGDKKGVDNSLNQIAEARKQISAERKKRFELTTAFSALYSKHKELHEQANNLQLDTQKAISVTQSWKNSADITHGQVQAILSWLNEISNLVTSFAREDKDET